MHGKLATCEYLQRIGIHEDYTCCFCGTEDESLDHLFFGCPFTMNVWEGVTVDYELQRSPKPWQEERNFLLTQCTTNSGKQKMYICVFSVVVYHIWRGRNHMRIKGTKQAMENIVKHCKIVMAWCSQRDKKIGRYMA